MPASSVSDRQKKWFSSLREGLERDTGKSLSEWVEIARTCPETKPRARQKWLKEKYGVGQNRAIMIFNEVFSDSLQWDNPAKLEEGLWKDEKKRSVYKRVVAEVEKLDGANVHVRKSFVGFSRKVQFAAAKPIKDGVRVGFAVDPAESSRLSPSTRRECWSERNVSVLELAKLTEIDAEFKRVLKLAWENS